ncbi:MAG: PorT family protein [Muribaculaceae bacterium]|nr:PorT family protein [Muribaculaceae bacterium]
MKKIAQFFMAFILATAATAPAAAKPFQIGPVVGMNVNSINLNSVADNFKADNRCGFGGGVMAKFTVPIINLGVDASVMYEYRSSQIENPDKVLENVHYNYLAVPIHARYDIPMPVVSKFIFPTIFTGPNLAFRMGKSILNDFKANKYNIGWDFGVGVTFVQHLQISAAYTLGISNKALSYVGYKSEAADIKGRTSGWTVTAAWLF